MVVVARMVGMLVGISALTTIGLRRYYAEQAGVPPVQDVCPAGTTRCSEYSDLLKAAGIAQEQTVFLGAAGRPGGRAAAGSGHPWDTHPDGPRDRLTSPS